MKKSTDKTVFLIIILAGASFLAMRYWIYLLAAVVLIGTAVVILYFRNPSFKFWLLSKLHRKPKKLTQKPEPLQQAQTQRTITKPPPRYQRPKPNVHKTVIVEAPFDPKKMTNKQLVDEIVSRGLGQ